MAYKHYFCPFFRLTVLSTFILKDTFTKISKGQMYFCLQRTIQKMVLLETFFWWTMGSFLNSTIWEYINLSSLMLELPMRVPWNTLVGIFIQDVSNVFHFFTIYENCFDVNGDPKIDVEKKQHNLMFGVHTRQPFSLLCALSSLLVTVITTQCGPPTEASPAPFYPIFQLASCYITKPFAVHVTKLQPL